MDGLDKSAYFKEKSLASPSFLERLLGKPPKRNAMIGLHNLICREEVTSLSPEMVRGLLLRYMADIRKEPCLSQAKGIYKKFLHFVLADRRVSNAEIRRLKHLQGLLMLKEVEVAALYEAVVGSVYKRTLREMLSDNRLDEEEKKTLEKMEKMLQIPKALAERLQATTYQEVLGEIVTEGLPDERVSDEEVREIEALQESLGVRRVELEEPTLALLKRYRLYWQIENNPLPTLEVPVRLQKTERCHTCVPCAWKEYREVTSGVGYGGPALQFKVAHGVYWRSGHYRLNRVKEDRLTFIDSGTLYLTNKRLLFVGEKNTRMLRLLNIVDFEVYRNGLSIKRTQGKAIFLGCEEIPDFLGMILGRCLQEL